jgi:hypothetical protein
MPNLESLGAKIADEWERRTWRLPNGETRGYGCFFIFNAGRPKREKKLRLLIRRPLMTLSQGMPARCRMRTEGRGRLGNA